MTKQSYQCFSSWYRIQNSVNEIAASRFRSTRNDKVDAFVALAALFALFVFPLGAYDRVLEDDAVGLGKKFGEANVAAQTPSENPQAAVSLAGGSAGPAGAGQMAMQRKVAVLAPDVRPPLPGDQGENASNDAATSASRLPPSTSLELRVDESGMDFSFPTANIADGVRHSPIEIKPVAEFGMEGNADPRADVYRKIFSSIEFRVAALRSENMGGYGRLAAAIYGVESQAAAGGGERRAHWIGIVPLYDEFDGRMIRYKANLLISADRGGRGKARAFDILVYLKRQGTDGFKDRRVKVVAREQGSGQNQAMVFETSVPYIREVIDKGVAPEVYITGGERQLQARYRIQDLPVFRSKITSEVLDHFSGDSAGRMENDLQAVMVPQTTPFPNAKDDGADEMARSLVFFEKGENTSILRPIAGLAYAIQGGEIRSLKKSKDGWSFILLGEEAHAPVIGIKSRGYDGRDHYRWTMFLTVPAQPKPDPTAGENPPPAAKVP